MTQDADGLRILVSTPDPRTGRGIANFIDTARPHFSGGVQFVLRGPRGEEGPLARAARALTDVLAFLKAVWSNRVDLVHQNTSFGTGGIIRDGVTLAAARCLGKRVLVFFHGWDDDLAGRLDGAPLHLFRLVYFGSAAFVVHSSGMERQLRGWGYEGPIFVETNIVDTRMLRLRPPEARGMGEPLRVLFLARVEREKGIFEALEALKIVQDWGLDVHLTVAGSGSALNAAQRYASKGGIRNVEFVGFVSGQAKVEAFASAHVYLLPTFHFEGMPNSLMEAIASGLAVITRPMGGIGDMFADDRMGWCSKTDDPEEFARYLKRLFHDDALRIRQGRYNIEFARDRLIAPRVVERLEHIYARIADDG